jgi:RimJ/RimL family protein N-acetyltransferase
MEVRRATIEDIRRIVDYMEAYHATSNLSDVPFHRLTAVRIIEYYCTHSTCYPLIAIDDKDQVQGLLIGGLEPYFFNEKKFYGTDLMFFSKGAGPALWKAFRDWAFDMGADRIIMGVSSGDDRAGQLLEALGMEPTGGMYVLRQESSKESS